jgi:putative endonuclease
MTGKIETGNSGETLAVKYLEKKGYAVVDRNVRLKRGEIDIIARQGGDLVFIEVKTRHGENCGSPLEAITPDKARNIALSIREYLYANLLTEENIRCDAVSILLPPAGEPQIELIKNAFDAGDYLC